MYGKSAFFAAALITTIFFGGNTETEAQTSKAWLPPTGSSQGGGKGNPCPAGFRFDPSTTSCVYSKQ